MSSSGYARASKSTQQTRKQAETGLLHEPPDNYSNVFGVCLSFPQMQKRRSSESTFSSWEEMECLPKWKNRSPKLWDSQFVINVTLVWPAAPPQPGRGLKVVMEMSLEKAHQHSCPDLGPRTGTT